MVENENNYKYELNRQRIRSSRSQGMDEMLSRSRIDNQNVANGQEQTGLLKRAKDLNKSTRQISKGAAQIAAGNKLAGAINIAKGAKDIGVNFLGGVFYK